MRLFTFLAFVAFLVLFIRSKSQFIFLVPSLASLAAFMLAIKLDLKYAFREKYTTNKLFLNNNELKILDHQYADRETGAAYTSIHPHLSADFDLFGPGSLFQYLNRCSTLGGKLKLAEGSLPVAAARNADQRETASYPGVDRQE